MSRIEIRQAFINIFNYLDFVYNTSLGPGLARHTIQCAQHQFDIQKTSDVNLKVYDMLGKEIAALVNEQLRPGSYQTEWIASGAATGVYYYRLTAWDFTETKKMILIK